MDIPGHTVDGDTDPIVDHGVVQHLDVVRRGNVDALRCVPVNSKLNLTLLVSKWVVMLKLNQSHQLRQHYVILLIFQHLEC